MRGSDRELSKTVAENGPGLGQGINQCVRPGSRPGLHPREDQAQHLPSGHDLPRPSFNGGRRESLKMMGSTACFRRNSVGSWCGSQGLGRHPLLSDARTYGSIHYVSPARVSVSRGSGIVRTARFGIVRRLRLLEQECCAPGDHATRPARAG